MIRFLLRAIGLISLAGAFILVIVDGTTSIGSNAVLITTIRSLWNTLNAASLQNLRPLVENTAGSWAWDPVLTGFLSAPAAAVLAVVGIVLIILGRKKRPLIGYAR